MGLLTQFITQAKEGPAEPGRLGYAAKLLLLTLVYIAIARLSLHFALSSGMISPLWPPSAIALCACLAWGFGMAPAIFAGAALTAWFSGTAALPATLIGTGNMLEACAGVWLIRRWLVASGLSSYSEGAFRCVAIAALCSAVAATIGVFALSLDGRHEAATGGLRWLTWWLGDTTGIIIVAPVLLAWRGAPRAVCRKGTMLETALLVLAVPTITYLAIGGLLDSMPLAYMTVPLILWAAFRFNAATVAWTTAAICAITVWSVARGRGLFAFGDLNTSLLLAMVYVSIVGTTGLVVAGLVRQRRQTEQVLMRERDALEVRVHEKTEALLQDIEKRRQVERQLAEAQHLAQLGSWNWDLTANRITWSDTLYQIYGLDRDSFVPTLTSARQIVHPGDLHRIDAAVERCRARGEAFQLEHRIVLPGGEVRFVAARGQLVHEPGGARMAGTVQDITEAKLAERTLRDAEARYRMVVELSPDAILVQRAGLLVFANRAACRMLGADRPEDIVGLSLLRLVDPAFHDITRQRMDSLRQGETQPAVEQKFLRLDGSAVDVELNASSFIHEGRPASLMILRDITERKKTLEQMAYLAHFDSLTGLPNRMLFHQRLEHALLLAERPGQSLEILFLDLDRFKNINDTLGHATGDLVLIETARRLQNILRESDTVARLGGDEFVVLVENINEPHRGGIIAEKILAAFEAPFLQDKNPLAITTSIGIASYPDDGVDAETLLKNADIAMYRAKEMGRSSYCYYSPEMNEHTAERLALEYALSHAIERNQLSLYYQPKVDVMSNRITGMEALLRWWHPTLGMIRPHRFIAIAEETGMIRSIGYWALRTACRQNKLWQDTSEARLRVAVNLSLRQLTDDNLLPNIRQILEETGLEARYLELEITESTVMSNPDKTILVLATLREMGISVAIDDFGIGYSSLAYLKQLPIRAVKIDRSFVQGIPGNVDDTAITKAIIGMAHSLECTVIAEGAETQQQLEFLREHACDTVQGYYFSEPMSAELFGDLLKVPSNLQLH